MRKVLLLSVLSSVALFAETAAAPAKTNQQKKKAAPPAAPAKRPYTSSSKSAPKPGTKTASATHTGVSRSATAHTKRGGASPQASSFKAGQKKTIANAKRTPSRQPATQYWRNIQRAPTPERYKEIQEALATKGYLEPGSQNGVWDTSSVAALKKFQQDQNLEPSGKLDSLSLIALGLGPKHDQPPAPARPQSP